MKIMGPQKGSLCHSALFIYPEICTGKASGFEKYKITERNKRKGMDARLIEPQNSKLRTQGLREDSLPSNFGEPSRVFPTRRGGGGRY